MKKSSQTETVSKIILGGDLSKLSEEEKVAYYKGYCERVGLDPFTKPFDILRLNGKEILYCNRSGCQQLNKLHSVSHTITSRELIEQANVYQVTSRASLPDGRYTESIGATNIGGLKGDAYANAIMKCETKSKRRATLDLLGLGVLDETEIETIINKEIKDLPPTFFEKKLESKDDIDMLLDQCVSIGELKTLYFRNQATIDGDKALKTRFVERKKTLVNE